MNISIKIKLLFLILLFISINISAQNNDTLYVLIRGEFKKKEIFTLKMNDEIIGNFGANKFYNGDFQVFFNNEKILPYQEIPLYIEKSKGNKIIKIKYPFFYYPDIKYIEIYYYPKEKIGFQIFYYSNSHYGITVPPNKDIKIKKLNFD